MEARERWSALQRHLARARELFEAGQLPPALQQVDAALAIDPEFLAAHALRDRIQQASAGANPVASAPPPFDLPLAAPDALSSGTGGFHELSAFEERVRRRRVERRAAAARHAIEIGRMDDAADALAELRAIDPDQPELLLLETAYEHAGLRVASHSTRTVITVAVFLMALLVASGIDRDESRRSAADLRINEAGHPAQPAASVQPVEPALPGSSSAAVNEDAGVSPVATVGPSSPVTTEANVTPKLPAVTAVVEADRRADAIGLPLPKVETPPAEAPPGPAVSTDALASPIADSAGVGRVVVASPTVLPAPPETRNRDVAPAVPPEPAGSAASVPATTIAPADERPAIQDLLARYRRAYEGLDARSAQAVWPAVNEQALARAFDELESQQVTFTRCDVQVRGVTADAICMGRVSYVTKVGHREPRVEPRTWTFALRKVDSDWTIESARVDH